MQKPFRALFVCLGNTHRSPFAEGYFRHIVQEQGLESQFEIDSAGIGASVGSSPNRVMAELATSLGFSIDSYRSTQFTPYHYHFNYLVAMDSSHLEYMAHHRPADYHGEIRLLSSWIADNPVVKQNQGNILDPFYNGEKSFYEAKDLIMLGCDALLEDIKSR